MFYIYILIYMYLFILFWARFHIPLLIHSSNLNRLNKNREVNINTIQF